MRLIAERVAVERGGRPVLTGIDLSVQAGEALAVVGPNGVGKTTLLRALAGLLPLASGSIRVEGGDPDLSLAEQTHFVGHRDGVKDLLTASENLLFWRDLFGGTGAPAEALERVGLARAADLPAYALSAGQRRRLGLARLLVAHRPVWLLDEPTSALDVVAQVSLGDIVDRYRYDGGIVVAATHADLGWTDLRVLDLAREAVR